MYPHGYQVVTAPPLCAKNCASLMTVSWTKQKSRLQTDIKHVWQEKLWNTSYLWSFTISPFERNHFFFNCSAVWIGYKENKMSVWHKLQFVQWLKKKLLWYTLIKRKTRHAVRAINWGTWRNLGVIKECLPHEVACKVQSEVQLVVIQVTEWG